MLRRMLSATVTLVFAALVLLAPETQTRAAGTAIISVDADSAAPGPQASGAALVSSPEIAIDIDIQNADAIGAFEFEALYDPLYLLFTRWTAAPFLGSTGRSPSCSQLIQETTVRVGCGTMGSPLPPGPSGDGVLATLYFRPRVMGQTCVLMTTAATSDVLGNTLPTSGVHGCVWIVSGDGDSDGDGCTDASELGPLHVYGGDRDPVNSWDFFDVPAPVLTASSPAGVRDRSIGITDVIAVLAYIGTAEGRGVNMNGAIYTSDLDGDGVADGREYDRSAANIAGKPWRTGPPDGAVTIQDAMLGLNQIGDHCPTTG